MCPLITKNPKATAKMICTICVATRIFRLSHLSASEPAVGASATGRPTSTPSHRASSDLGALTALEQEQSVAEPVARRVSWPAKTAVLEDRRRASHQRDAELRLSSARALICGAARHLETSLHTDFDHDCGDVRGRRLHRWRRPAAETAATGRSSTSLLHARGRTRDQSRRVQRVVRSSRSTIVGQ